MENYTNLEDNVKSHEADFLEKHERAQTLKLNDARQ